MKKRMKTVISLAITLALTLSLALPALAYQDTDPPQWEEWGYASLEELLADFDMTEEEYYEVLVAPDLNRQNWIDAHPEEVAAFDPYSYFDQKYYYYESPEEYMEWNGLDEEGFRQDMLLLWATNQMENESQQRELEEFIAAHPAEYAAFDPHSYFEQNYYYMSPEEYMEWSGLDEEGFRQDMLLEWMWAFKQQQAQQEMLVQAKLAAGGSPDGVNVMVNGACIPFPDARPEIRDGRTMVPLAAAMEYLGAAVSYDQASHTARVSMGELSFTHAIGTGVLSLDDGNQIAMDVPSYVKDGRTMVPVAFFAQALGYEVYWDGIYETAVLLDRHGLAEEIDAQFTLVNRLLYTLSGADLRREGQSLKSDLDLELVITMLDSLNGDKSYKMELDGSNLDNGTVSSAKYTADLGQLMDLLLDNLPFYIIDGETRQELESYRDMLSRISVDLIIDLERQCLYLRCPLLAQLGLMESPDTWAALPLEGLMDAFRTGTLTVGELLVSTSFDAGWSPFNAWETMAFSAGEGAALIGDGCFTKSGSSYTLGYSEESPWWYGSGDELETLSALLKITPAGQKGCSYSLTLETRNPEALLTYALTGSSGRADLEMTFHEKNVAKGTLEMTIRYSATRQQPQAQPPAGDRIEYPAGILGTGTLDGGMPK